MGRTRTDNQMRENEMVFPLGLSKLVKETGEENENAFLLWLEVSEDY